MGGIDFTPPPPPPPRYPYRKGEALIVGEVEYRFCFAGEFSRGRFLITSKMLDALRALMVQSEKELEEPFNPSQAVAAE